MIGVRLGLYVVLGATFGLSAFGLYGLQDGNRRYALALRPWLVGLSIVGLVLSGVALTLLAASMTGTSPWPINRDAIAMLLSGSTTGTAWKTRMIALVVALFASAISADRSKGLAVVVVAACVALSTLAWGGHGVMDEGIKGWVHLATDILHLIAAGAWTGALLGLILLVTRPAAQTDAAHLALTHRALHGFGVVGTVIVTALVITGVINVWLLVGPDNITSIGMTLYGVLLLGKLALFAAVLVLASLNRFRITPAFGRSIADGDSRRAIGTLRWSMAVETTCILLIMGLVAWLGTLPPGPTS